MMYLPSSTHDACSAQQPGREREKEGGGGERKRRDMQGIIRGNMIYIRVMQSVPGSHSKKFLGFYKVAAYRIFTTFSTNIISFSWLKT